MDTGYPNGNVQKLAWKQALKDACIKLINERVANIEQAMLDARESANSEEKSSAGDKYETSRAMGHLAQEMQSKQLEDARQELDTVNRISTTNILISAVAGAVVICTDIIFYISPGPGTVAVEGHKVMLLSPKAPVAALLYQKKAGDTFVFNKKTIKILDIF